MSRWGYERHRWIQPGADRRNDDGVHIDAGRVGIVPATGGPDGAIERGARMLRDLAPGVSTD